MNTKTGAELYPAIDPPNWPAYLAQIEPGVRPLCDAINELPDTYTLWSCEGHPEREAKPYVTFIAPQDIAFSLSRLIEFSPHLKFNWVLTAGFREDGSMQYTLRPCDIRLTRQGFAWRPRKQWSHDQMCAELLRLAQLVARESVFSDKDQRSIKKNDAPLFIAFPTSRNAHLNPQYALRVENFLSSVSERIGEDGALYWWTYRVEPHVCIACDIHGANESLNITMSITGSTVIPEGPDGDFDLKDACDAWCLLSMLADRLGLRYVAPIGQGLQFSSREIEK